MGTRNSTLVKIDNEFKVAKYCQWDGYPKGQGVTILDILRSCNLDELKEKCSKVTDISHEEIEELWLEVGADKSGFVDSEVSKRFEEKHFHLHRNCGGEILTEIISGRCIKTHKDVEFAQADDIFCEWSYIVDFDTNEFRTYSGTINDRNLVVSYPLNNLPTEETFLEDCQKQMQ